jgi:hypothetical protein
MNYPSRLQFLKLELLESRRIKADLLLCFKIVKGFVDLQFDDFFAMSTATMTRGHTFKLQLPRRNTDIRAQSFSVRVVPFWNDLSQECVDSPTVASFKAHLRSVNYPHLLEKYV